MYENEEDCGVCGFSFFLFFFFFSFPFYLIFILGERMRSRCTAATETVCAPCQDEYFNTEHNHNFCKSCTVCHTRKGSVEVKKCEKTSDRICMCTAGYMPDARYTLGSVCSPCREGFYSKGGNESCRPWTKYVSLIQTHSV
uniref:TNFR-Cys domain-containing protein n=1 Tax=Dromaius novaehollandiae TaxID=8790 RepID=A0A8C4JV40_DRONO